jgi:benzoyl-CoA reductase subunit BamB
MRYAETGFNLEIDLSRGSIDRVETDPKDTELYLGGLGTNAKILWDRVPPEVEPFSPDNLLIFSAGLYAAHLLLVVIVPLFLPFLLRPG